VACGLSADSFSVVIRDIGAVQPLVALPVMKREMREKKTCLLSVHKSALNQERLDNCGSWHITRTLLTGTGLAATLIIISSCYREFGNPTKYGLVSIHAPGNPRTYPNVEVATLAVDAT
jgi:hypothetical protein